MNITFLVYRLNRDRLLSTEFYRQDLEILQSLGHKVHVATKLKEVPADTDLVFLWWWNWLWFLGPVLRRLGAPICVTGSLEPDIFVKRSRLYKTLVRYGMRYADRSVFVSQYMIDNLRPLMRLDNPLLCPHIVLDEYKPASQENHRRLPHTIFNVAWKTKANCTRKMLPELIEAFSIVVAQMPSAKLVLAGEQMDGGAALVRRVRELGLSKSVEFLGKIDKSEKISLMQECGAYYQCSRHEGFGLAIAEAMACGAPVVVNHKTAIPEVVGPCGYYVENESIESIAASLLKCLRNPEESRRIGQDAAARIDELYRIDRRRDFFKNLFAEMMREGSRPNQRPTALQRAA